MMTPQNVLLFLKELTVNDLQFNTNDIFQIVVEFYLSYFEFQEEI